MKSFTADLNLSFEAREIVLIEGKEFTLSTEHNQAFDGLSQQKLMVERYICTSIFQGKNNPDPHCLFYLG